MLVAVFAATITAYAAILPVTNDAAGAASLAAALASPSADVTGASFVSVTGGTPNAVADAPLSSFPTEGSTFAILTSGNASLADDPNVAINSGQKGRPENR